MYSKSSLRMQLLKLRESFSSEYVRKASTDICSHLIRFCGELEAEFYCSKEGFAIGRSPILNILAYAAKNNEVCLDTFIEERLAKGHNVFLPRVTGETSMEFYRFKDLNDLELGRYNIKSPKEGCAKLEKVSPDTWMILPCVGVNLKGNRIGHGRGYYDRYLQLHDQIALSARIVPCYDKLLEACESIPGEDKARIFGPFDQSVGWIVSETRIIRVSHDE